MGNSGEFDQGISMSNTRLPAITLNTRWRDAKGREWRIIEKYPFGRNECCLVDAPWHSGGWTTREIRAAIAAASPAAEVKP